ncbi:Y-family DNA polymerase [bacterium]|nr:Y-family DNA polymerase [bacterium]
MSKYVALVDCNSFFCSCERKTNPELNNRPLCVVSGERGCIIARSTEAKLMGIKMGIPLFKAVQEYPNCIYITANHQKYFEISKKIMYILKEFSPNIEVYSIDEAFVDLTGLQKAYKKNYFQIARLMKDKIWQEIGIPVSIGVSKSKTLAKLASDRAKSTEDGILLLGKSKIKNYLKNVEISEVWGIGKKLTIRFRKFGIKTVNQFISKDDKWIKNYFGKNGLVTKYELQGKYINHIINNPPLPKSIIDTQSFPEFTSNFDYIKNELNIHIHTACSRLRQIGCKCNKIGVIIKTKDFNYSFLELKLENPTDFELNISKSAYSLLKKMYLSNTPYRSVGIILSEFTSVQNEQLKLFDNEKTTKKNEKLGKTIDKLERKFGRNIIQVGFIHKKIPNKQNFMTSPTLIY